ncbi:ComF family protein [Romboutsia ilealis]|uniref:ComF family protein n=1 Tax=Romboutsia faecis TaxID=2764597 RepID=A0ABR7JS75_9FIRM|nr:ComF family protein [Romboutsia faecis]MRN25464.1 ComF family protein [Romboutsia ilealis]
MSFYEVLNFVLDFIYPENISCILCDKPIKKVNTYSLCKDCFKELNFIQDGCIKCGKPIIYHSLEKIDICGCSYCFNKSFYFDKSISCIEYSDISKSMILGFKYKNKTYMAKYISNIMKEKLDLENIEFDYITFVPLHKKRMRKRGFNQSEKIAKELSKIINIPILDCIYRKSNTNRLYNLNRQERKIELKNAFLVKENINYANGKNILLIDDIFTTGSTVNEISKLLRLNNVNRIFVMTLLTKSNDNYIKAEN